MCRMMALIGKFEAFEAPLEHFLTLCPNGRVNPSDTPGHLDGWGLSGYSRGRAVYFARSIGSAWLESADYKKACSKAVQVETPVLIAHFRKASVGNVAMQNTHPFIAREWLFAHNGTILNSGEIFACEQTPTGETDSERYFLWVLDTVANAIDPTEALRERIREARELATYTSLSFLLTDGKTLWAYRDFSKENFDPGETLSDRDEEYRLYVVQAKGVIVFASEPVGENKESWRELPNRTLAVATSCSTLELFSL